MLLALVGTLQAQPPKPPFDAPPLPGEGTHASDAPAGAPHSRHQAEPSAFSAFTESQKLYIEPIVVRVDNELSQLPEERRKIAAEHLNDFLTSATSKTTQHLDRTGRIIDTAQNALDQVEAEATELTLSVAQQIFRARQVMQFVSNPPRFKFELEQLEKTNPALAKVVAVAAVNQALGRFSSAVEGKVGNALREEWQKQ
ncbi:hypothetical protein K2X33_03105, partial [bacterium]|nr:hypothetical protein [bacterium]